MNQKDMKIICGITYPIGEKGKTIEIPSEKTGERKVPTLQNMQEVSDFITASNHTSELDEKGRVVRRRDENGKVLTGKEETQKGGEDR